VSVFVLDSNIVSFYIRQKQKIIQRVQEELMAGNEVLVGPIAYYEVKRGLISINAPKRLRQFYALCTVLGVGQLDNTILDTGTEIYRDLRDKKSLIEDADILTAAFCLNHAFTLVTNNAGHFQAISGLRFCDWE
jgi:predicted nucleic acid-binding protein